MDEEVRLTVGRLIGKSIERKDDARVLKIFDMLRRKTAGMDVLEIIAYNPVLFEEARKMWDGEE